jgi:carboxymethylenebutenolidase
MNGPSQEHKMKRRMEHLILPVVFCLFFAASSVRAQSGQEITFRAGGEIVHGMLYLPQGNGAHPAVVVVHEWWGLTDWVKEQARDLAAQGYVALAVDLYRGKVTDNPQVARSLMLGLSRERAVLDLTSAVKWLDGRKDVDPKRIGAIGWCMGGGFAAQLAVADPGLKAVVINYGELPASRAALERIQAPVLGTFGGEDRVVPPAAVRAFAATMKSLGKSVQVKIYPDAGHAFENPNNQSGYRPADTADAEARTRSFLAKYLRPGGAG